MPPGPGDLLDIATLTAQYADGSRTPAGIIAEVRRRIDSYPDPAVWINRSSEKDLEKQLSQLESARAAGAKLPLYGIPFAVKDNIDVAARPTTAACPAFAYVPTQSATVVRKLCEAGAILVGKTNLDQFATGLVGVRSPYGACFNPFNPAYITGGSSSGSAVAVAGGLVSFALGTDTAGSGRVPAAFNNIVGYKPTRGLISNAGVVPACRSLDCVSIFALTCADAEMVANVARGFDPDDPYSRADDEFPSETFSAHGPRVGIPTNAQLSFFGNREFERIYLEAVVRLESLGATKVSVDLEPFLLAGKLLYEGPWVAERVAGLRDFIEKHPNDLLPVISKIFSSASRFNAADTFAGAHLLATHRQAARREWAKADMILLPTAGTIYTQAQVAADPIQLNKNLGYYTQFVNLLDLCAVAVPAGFTHEGLPAGVTLIAGTGQDQPLLEFADLLHRQAGLKLGATGCGMPSVSKTPSSHWGVRLAVVGAHLSGQPLNWQLTQRNGRLVRATKTAPCYELYALANTAPPKPGLVRVDAGKGSAIDLEVWELSTEAFGSFVADVPAPLAIGSVQLEDGTTVKGFLCEACALNGAENITHLGGWRTYQKLQLRNGG